MARALLALAPWLLVAGGASLWVGAARCPATMTIGYEKLFEDLWSPVALGGLVVLGVGALSIPAAVAARRGPLRDELVRTRLAPAPLAALALAGVAFILSGVAQDEAERRSDEAYAISIATLHGEVAPVPGTVRFHDDWRRTARLGRTLHLVAVLGFGTWIVWRAALAARRSVPGRPDGA